MSSSSGVVSPSSCRKSRTPTRVEPNGSAHQKKKDPRGSFSILREYPYLLPPLRPGSPGTPPSSSFEREGSPWFELPGSQPSGPLPTPWLHFACAVPPRLPPWQPRKATSVNVTAALANARPSNGVGGLPAIPVVVM